jgi:hypothetical protein
MNEAGDISWLRFRYCSIHTTRRPFYGSTATLSSAITGAGTPPLLRPTTITEKERGRMSLGKIEQLWRYFHLKEKTKTEFFESTGSPYYTIRRTYELGKKQKRRGALP